MPSGVPNTTSLGFERKKEKETGMSVTTKIPQEQLELELDRGDHRVYQPQEVWVVEEPNGFVSSIEIVRPNGRREIVNIKQVGLRRRI